MVILIFNIWLTLCLCLYGIWTNSRLLTISRVHLRIHSVGYEKLTNKRMMMRVRKHCNWVKSLNGRLRGLRLSRSRKFFSTVLFSSRIVRIYNEVVNRIMNMESSYPVIVLPTQWGLPVLSHPSRSVIVPSNRKVIFY
jgi:hypothetical protein